MKKMLAVLVLISVISISSLGYTYDGKRSGTEHPRHSLLNQLPQEKKMLFHQTMLEAREITVNIRQQIKELKAEIKNILTAPEFNDALFLEKVQNVQELYIMMKQARNDAIVKLAKEFTQEERRILAALVSEKHRHRGRWAGR